MSEKAESTKIPTLVSFPLITTMKLQVSGCFNIQEADSLRPNTTMFIMIHAVLLSPSFRHYYLPIQLYLLFFPWPRFPSGFVGARFPSPRISNCVLEFSSVLLSSSLTPPSEFSPPFRAQDFQEHKRHETSLTSTKQFCPIIASPFLPSFVTFLYLLLLFFLKLLLDNICKTSLTK